MQYALLFCVLMEPSRLILTNDRLPTVVAPIIKARKSVKDVIVMETPCNNTKYYKNVLIQYVKTENKIRSPNYSYDILLNIYLSKKYKLFNVIFPSFKNQYFSYIFIDKNIDE